MQFRSNTARIVIMALLIALEIILTRFCSINTPVMRIGFGFLPAAMMGIMFGPLWAGIGCAVSDVLGMLIFPTGVYFPGFTFTAFLTGLTFGIFTYKKNITWKNVLPASLITIVGLDLFLNTLWLSMLMGDGFIGLLPVRVFQCIIMFPLQLILIPLIWNRILSKLPIAPQRIHDTSPAQHDT